MLLDYYMTIGKVQNPEVRSASFKVALLANGSDLVGPMRTRHLHGGWLALTGLILNAMNVNLNYGVVRYVT